MGFQRARSIVAVLFCVACGASSSRGDGGALRPDAGKASGSGAANGSGGVAHAGSGGTSHAPVGAGTGGAPHTADASSASADAGASASAHDAAIDAAVHDAGHDAGSAPNTHACPLVDDCGTHQGAHCPAALPIGACNTTDECYYCDGPLATRPSIDASCVSGKWSWRTAQSCSH